MGKCLIGTYTRFCCRKSGHIWSDCIIAKTQGRECNQAQTSGLNSDAPKKNHYYTLKSRGHLEDSPNVVTGMLCVFQ